MIKRQRIKLHLEKPNPLFENWLEEWLKYAVQKNSLKNHSIQKALESLKKYPLVLHSGRDCCILEGFGHTICRMLDKQLALYKETHTVPTENEHNKSVQDVIRKVQVEIQKPPKTFINKSKNDALESQLSDMFQKFNDMEKEFEMEQNLGIGIEKPTEKLIQPNSFNIVLLVDTQETAG